MQAVAFLSIGPRNDQALSPESEPIAPKDIQDRLQVCSAPTFLPSIFPSNLEELAVDESVANCRITVLRMNQVCIGSLTNQLSIAV